MIYLAGFVWFICGFIVCWLVKPQTAKSNIFLSNRLDCTEYPPAPDSIIDVDDVHTVKITGEPHSECITFFDKKGEDIASGISDCWGNVSYYRKKK